jgi:K+-sensing histidine kinase KdpD
VVEVDEDAAPLEARRTRAPSPGVMLTVAIGAPTVAAAVLSGFLSAIEPSNGALVLVVIVVAVAATGHRAAGMLAAVSSAVSFAYFLTEPVHQLTIANPDDLATAALLVVVGVAVSEIAQWGRRRQLEGALRLGHLDGMVATARLVSRTGDPDTTAELVGRQIADVLQVPTCTYEPRPPSASTATITPDGRLVRDGVEMDPGRSGLPTMDAVAIPVFCAGTVRGCYVIYAPTAVVRPDREQFRVAAALADQAGTALAHRTG